MSNMGYCRFENTFNDLQDCVDNWDNAKSDSEKRYRKKILRLAQTIVDDFGPLEEDDESSEDDNG